MNQSLKPQPQKPRLSKASIGVLGVILTAALAAAILVLPGYLSRDPPAVPESPSQPNPWINPTNIVSAPTARSMDYVGSDQCTDCHSEIAAQFARHPMGNSLKPVHRATVIEDYTGGPKADQAQHRGPTPAQQANFQAGASRMTIRREGDRVSHRDTVVDRFGQELVSQEVTVDYTVGSGSRGRSYLINRQGLLFQSPITWYVEDKIWDLSPGYFPDRHQRFERRVDADCLSCHAGRMRLVQHDPDQFDPRQPFHEQSIGCERCHGPGGAHVRFQQGLALGDPAKPTQAGSENTRADPGFIVNPATLSLEQQHSICNQCHLSGKVRIPRFGRSFYDFRPGESLGETWTVFVSGSGFDEDGRADFTSHVQQMHSSKCFQMSDGRMGCVTCHDPHRQPPPDERREFYRQRCLTCHGNQDCSLPQEKQAAPPASNSCYHCHMPRTDSSDIAHATLADHRLLKRPRATGGADKLDAPMQANATQQWHIFDHHDSPLQEWEKNRALGMALFRQGTKKLEAGDASHTALFDLAEQKMKSSLSVAGNDSVMLTYLGRLYFHRGDMKKARQALHAARHFDPRDRSALIFLGLICLQENDTEQGTRYFRELLDLDPWHAMEQGAYAAMLRGGGNSTRAIEVLEKAIEINPTLVPLRRDLAQLYRQAGEIDKALIQEHLARCLYALRPKP